MEVKTGSTHSQTEQLENYLDIAKEQGYDAVLTISNEIPAVAGQHPTKVDKRKLRKVALHHLSWTQVLAEAVMQKEFRGVADPDQAWILGELIRYLEHSRSGALEFDDMGETWVAVRDAVAAGTLRATDKGIADVVARFDALLRFASLRLGRQLGTEVVPVLSRKEQADPTLRAQALTAMLCQTGQLSGAIRIPDTVGQLVVTADLRSVEGHLPRRRRRAPGGSPHHPGELAGAPAQGRARLRARGDVHCPRARLQRRRAAGRRPGEPRGPGGGPGQGDPVLPPGATAGMGTKRGRGRGSFIDSVLSATDTFYADVLQYLKAWSAAPPKLRQPGAHPPDAEPTTPRSLASTEYSSQDGVEPVGDPTGAAADLLPGSSAAGDSSASTDTDLADSQLLNNHGAVRTPAGAGRWCRGAQPTPRRRGRRRPSAR